MLSDTRKFDEMKKRYSQLEAFLSDHEVVTDSAATAKYARELSEISPVVKRYNELLDAQKQLAELTHILSDKSHAKDFLELAAAEIIELKKKAERLSSELEDLTKAPDPDLNRNCMIEIRAGTGGQEASLFAGDLYRMYTKYAASKNWTVELMAVSATDLDRKSVV